MTTSIETASTANMDKQSKISGQPTSENGQMAMSQQVDSPNPSTFSNINSENVETTNWKVHFLPLYHSQILASVIILQNMKLLAQPLIEGMLLTKNQMLQLPSSNPIKHPTLAPQEQEKVEEVEETHHLKGSSTEILSLKNVALMIFLQREDKNYISDYLVALMKRLLNLSLILATYAVVVTTLRSSQFPRENPPPLNPQMSVLMIGPLFLLFGT